MQDIKQQKRTEARNGNALRRGDRRADADSPPATYLNLDVCPSDPLACPPSGRDGPQRRPGRERADVLDATVNDLESILRASEPSPTQGSLNVKLRWKSRGSVFEN